MKYFSGIFIFILASVAMSISLCIYCSYNAFASEPSGPLEYVKQDFDVLHYDALLNLTKAPLKDMNGVTSIKFKWVNKTDTSRFYFHLKDLKIDSAFWGLIPVTPYTVGEPDDADYHYAVVPPSGLDEDTSRLSIFYSGTMTGEPQPFPFGGVQNTNTTLFAMGVGFGNNYVSATRHWMPCYDHPSDKATFTIGIKVMKGKFPASIGTISGIEAISDTNIFIWNHTKPCATYLATFAVDDYFPVDISTSPLPMVVYARAVDTAAARSTFRLLPRMVEAFGKRFLPYPFEKVGYCVTPIGSMEHQTMISYDRNYMRSIYSYNDSVNAVAAHELAHQWFGDYVTCRDFRDAWLNEGFATYCESIWQEELYGWDAYVKLQKSKANKYINSISVSEGLMPLYDFPREEPSSNYPSTIYQKGAVVAGMLRYEAGDSLFFEAIRKFLKDHAYSTATTEDLKNAFEEITGKSFDNFFDQWVYQAGYPIITANINKLASGEYVKAEIQLRQVQQQQYGSYTDIPVEIGFKLGDGSLIYRLVRLNDKDQNFTIDSLPDFTKVTINEGNTVALQLKVNSITGIDGEDTPPAFLLEVSPNPASNSINISLPDFTGKAMLRVSDIEGSEVYSGTIDGHEYNGNYTLDTWNFSQGVYYISLECRKSIYRASIVINK